MLVTICVGTCTSHISQQVVSHLPALSAQFQCFVLMATRSFKPGSWWPERDRILRADRARAMSQAPCGKSQQLDRARKFSPSRL